MEGSKRHRLRPGSCKRSEGSPENSSICISAKTRSARSRLQPRIMSHFGDSRTHHKQETPLEYENTYKLAPDMSFSTSSAEQTIQGVFEQYLQDVPYDPIVFPRLIRILTEVIKEKFKDQYLDRYKMIVTVTAVQKKEQGVQISSRALWNNNIDNYATFTYEGYDYFIIGTTYAIYLD